MGGWQPQCHRPAASLELSTFCFSAAEPPPPPPLSLLLISAHLSLLLSFSNPKISDPTKSPFPPKSSSTLKIILFLPKDVCISPHPFPRTLSILLFLRLCSMRGGGGSLASSPTRCTAPLFYGTCIYHCDHSCAGVVQELDHNQPLFFIVASSRTNCNGTFP